jgi:hypothetical protein
MNGVVNRVEARQSEDGSILSTFFVLDWLRRNSALIPRSDSTELAEVLLRGASLL